MIKTIEPLEIIHMVTRPDYIPVNDIKTLSRFLLRQQVKNYRNDWVTSWSVWSNTSADHRLGQKFMNAIPDKYYDMLTGTPIDPYHKNDATSIYIALDYIMFMEA